ERLGAKQDGVLRSHQIMCDGSIRDTVVYSILQHEWPSVKNNLLSKLSLNGDVSYRISEEALSVLHLSHSPDLPPLSDLSDPSTRSNLSRTPCNQFPFQRPLVIVNP